MSFGTFMDSALFNLRADLGTLSGEISHLTAPITPNFVFEHRQGKRAQAMASLDLHNDGNTQEIEMPENKKEEEKKDTRPLLLETSKSNPVDNVDEVLKNLATMANDSVKRNQVVEELTRNSELMGQISTYMASEFIKDFNEEMGSEEIPNSLKSATIGCMITALQGLQKEFDSGNK